MSLPKIDRSCAAARGARVRFVAAILASSLAAAGYCEERQRALSPKAASAFFPAELVARARANARDHAWAAAIRDPLIAAAKPWMDRSDDELWGLMFGNTLKRAWQVWSDGYCPSCRAPVPMYEWVPEALAHPWKMRCPKCNERFPKNDFEAFYRSGLNGQGLFIPAQADRALLFNVEHPDPADPLHGFGVDDGDGYVAEGHRWRFINAYLIFGQWKQGIVDGIRNLAGAYVATGDAAYARKAGVLLDRAADFYPTFDFGKEGVMYEGAPRSGYVSTWHDACVEVQALAIAYDAVFEGMRDDPSLVAFLSAKAAGHGIENPKAAFADVQRNIEERIFRDTLANRPKIESNYPATDACITTIETALGWPGNRETVLGLLDGIIDKATLADGLTGEKGIAGYSVIAPHAVAALLGGYARIDAGFIPEMLRRHPRLRDMYRFHLDTWCLGLYYPRTGDTGGFAERNVVYAGLPFTRNPGIGPSSYAFLWELFKATGDADFARLILSENGGKVEGLPYDLFGRAPAEFQRGVEGAIAEHAADFRLASVNKQEWHLAILRSGAGANERALWLDYDSGERHGHADGMTMGLFAKGLDLLPDFGYPPVQYGGWAAPRSVWYTQTAAHCTVSVDGKNTIPGAGKTTLWFDGGAFRAARAEGAELAGAARFERTLALVDISEEDAYAVDVFRVVGGKSHTRFLHGHFGNLATEGLKTAPTGEASYGEVMRNFRRDPAPQAEWAADWKIEDHLKFLPPGREIHLRLRDLTRGAEIETAETWVSVGRYGGTAEAWIPSVLASRRAENGPLATTFVAALEPYEGAPKIASARRLELRGEDGSVLSDENVGIELTLADGRRDVVLAIDSGAAAVEGRDGILFRGELAWIRHDAKGKPIRAALCRGIELDVGGLRIKLRDATACVEFDLERPEAPISAGAVEAVESVKMGEAWHWPK